GVEVLVRADRARPAQEVGVGGELLEVQGLPRRAEPDLLLVEVDAALPVVRGAVLHAEPLPDAGLRGVDAPGAVGGVREGVLAAAAVRAAAEGAARRVVEPAADVQEALGDPGRAEDPGARVVRADLAVQARCDRAGVEVLTGGGEKRVRPFFLSG